LPIQTGRHDAPDCPRGIPTPPDEKKSPTLPVIAAAMATLVLPAAAQTTTHLTPEDPTNP